MSKIKAEYIWMDGHTPTQKLRSKTTIIDGPVTNLEQLCGSNNTSRSVNIPTSLELESTTRSPDTSFSLIMLNAS